MKKEYVIKSMNLSGATVLILEKCKDRVEFEALAIYLMGGVSDNTNELSKCWPDLPDPCSSEIPEVPHPTCVQWYNPPCDHTPPCDNTPIPGGDNDGE